MLQNVSENIAHFQIRAYIKKANSTYMEKNNE